VHSMNKRAEGVSKKSHAGGTVGRVGNPAIFSHQIEHTNRQWRTLYMKHPRVPKRPHWH